MPGDSCSLVPVLGYGYYLQVSTVNRSHNTGGHVNVLSDYKETVPEKSDMFTQSLQSCRMWLF